eukprot:m.60499 g.60499  ORF g.60499 m.60499 type:complete len:181 (-) comp11326_c1_seq4:145-687(-)
MVGNMLLLGAIFISGITTQATRISHDNGLKALRRINCGGTSTITHNNVTWESDWGYNTGLVATEIGGDELLGTNRWDKRPLPNLIYRIPVAVNSSIRVVLHFLELMPKSLGERVFNVEINGHMVARELDVMSTANATGAPAPVVVSFDTVITARDKGLLAVELVPVTGAAFLSALEVLQH